MSLLLPRDLRIHRVADGRETPTRPVSTGCTRRAGSRWAWRPAGPLASVTERVDEVPRGRITARIVLDPGEGR
ncbi:hypothetical protein [Streptomyces sp. NPDC050988]|uniref:hypothetical protein n=1 Tax=Streptomyces sp. NPDC050988 TaxID=3365637 RepID=UPI0037A86C29